MATISITGNTLSASLGLGSFTDVGDALTNAKTKTSDLRKGLESLKGKIDAACAAADITSSENYVKKAEKRESTKKSSLSLAYDKLNTLISNVGTVDNKVSKKVEQLKNDFYKKYDYLKPECEKANWKKP